MMSLKWMCCCNSCCCGEPPENRARNRKDLEASDYLLPGGKWDPSLSRSRSWWSSRGSSKTGSQKSKSSQKSRSLEESRTGEYEPPTVPPSRTLPTFEEFRLLKTVGRGAFGKVLLCVHISTRILYAMKVVPKAKITTQKQINQILAESRILKGIRHPFCVSLQYAFQNDDYLFYIFQFAAGGMLFHHLRQEGKFVEHRARFYFGEIVLALDYLHSFGIVFRDLKPENCMLSEKGHIVLTDFGSAKMLEVSEKTTTIAGTPQYIAPEVLRGEPYSFSADWWSCGILLHEMLLGKAPFNSPDRVELYKLVLRGDFTVPKTVSPRARALLYRLINGNPELRVGCACGECYKHSAKDIKEHGFFSRTPLDPDEETQYATEEAERERHREAFAKSKRSSRTGSLVEAAGQMFRTLSVSTTKRISNTRPPYMGEPCNWTWEELEHGEVKPPFTPKLTSPTDLRHFDPTMTCIPPTLSDLVTTDRDLHLEGFDYVAPEWNLTTSLELTSEEHMALNQRGRSEGTDRTTSVEQSEGNSLIQGNSASVSHSAKGGHSNSSTVIEVVAEINES